MDKKALVNLALSGLAAFLAAFAATYQLSGDTKASVTAGASAALAGFINHLRQSPTA